MEWSDVDSNVPTIDSSSSAADDVQVLGGQRDLGVSREETDRQTVISARLR